MAFFCQRDNDNLFTCKSSFTPYVPPVEKVFLQDPIPTVVKEEKKKSNGFEYLPGQRLLVELGKKHKFYETKKEPEKIDVDRLSKSLARVIKIL